MGRPGVGVEQFGKTVVWVGLVTAGVGALLWAVGRLFPGVRFGRLPGDVVVEKPGFGLYFPITTMILVSVVLTLVFWLIGALRR